MMMVLDAGMSSPDSTMAVETSTSACPSTNLTMTLSSSRSAICPCPITTRASGTSPWMNVVIEARDWIRLWTKKTCPPRFSSRSIASLMTARLKAVTTVSTGSRSSGGVSITDRSRTPERAMCSVRGIGVAVRVSTSTAVRSCLMRSLWVTPKRCSSSTTSRPRFLNRTSRERSRWVPTTTSTAPLASPATTAFCSLALRKRDSNSTFAGNGAKRSTKVL